MSDRPGPTQDQITEAKDLARHAAETALSGVSRIAQLAPAPALPGILFNSGFALLDLAARATVALHKRDTSRLEDRDHPDNVTMMRVFADAMRFYPDLKAITDHIAAAANELSDGTVRAVSVTP